MNTETEVPSAEEMIKRIRTVFAELGWKDVELISADYPSYDGWPVIGVPYSVPLAITWMAGDILYPQISCWSCWLDPLEGPECLEGRCAHPEGPARPPRELLKARGE